MKIKHYLRLIKPGIVIGNIITILSGMLLAFQGFIEISKIFFVLLGTFFIISSGCVINNLIDADVDEKMSRTKSRGLVKKKISIKKAIFLSIFFFF